MFRTRLLPLLALSAIALVFTAPAQAAPPSSDEWPQIGSTRTGSYATYVLPGDTLTVTRVAWSGDPATVSFQWQRCSLSWVCTEIAGADAPAYVVTESDLGYRLHVAQVATNADGSAAKDAWTLVVGAPWPSVWPVLALDDGRNPYFGVDVGDSLVVSAGEWFGAPSSFDYAWRRCDDTRCTVIDGATSPSYTITEDDRGAFLYADVTGTNVWGSWTAGAGVGHRVGELVLTPTAAPQLGSDRSASLTFVGPGDTLTVSDGTWSAPATFTYRWQRCLLSTNVCTEISGETSRSYLVRADDRGYEVSAIVDAHSGSTTASARTYAPVVGQPAPASTAWPMVRSSRGSSLGYVLPGDVLTVASNGDWLGDPTSFTYQWRRHKPMDWSTTTPIAGATEQSYTVTADDLGYVVDVEVSAWNDVGHGITLAWSGQTVGAPYPVSGAWPHVLNAPDRLTLDFGSWLGDPQFSIQWSRRDPHTGTATAIPGETGTSYAPTPADRGYAVFATLTATNAYGSTSFDLGWSTVIGGPTYVSGPIGISTGKNWGMAVLPGDTLSVDTGTWTGEPVFTFQWARCSPSGDACVDVPGETGPTYRVTAADDRHRIHVALTATNDLGSVTFVYATAQAVGAPGITAGGYPIITSSRGSTSYIEPGDVLTVSAGEWTGGPVTVSYQWIRCANGYCTPIDGETAASYTVTETDLGRQVQAWVTATNDVGSVSLGSYGGPPVGAPGIPPSDFARVQSSRGVEPYRFVGVGDTLSAEPGTWLGSPTSYTYRWQRCQPRERTLECTDVGATGRTYVVAPADRSFMLQVSVTAVNAYGSNTVTAVTSFVDAPGLDYGLESNASLATGRADGSAFVGDVLTFAPGTWLGNPTSTTYSWSRCARGDCEELTDTGLTHELTSADRGATIYATVTAQNDAGVGYAWVEIAVSRSTAFTSATVAPSPVGGWSRAPVVTLVARDDYGPGIASTEYRIDDASWATYTTPFAVTGDGAHTVSYRSTDTDGNVGPTGSRELRVDSTGPVVDVTAPERDATYLVGAAVTPVVTCTDSGSGVATCTHVDVDTASVGKHVFTATATDVAGNTATVTRGYTVVWPWSGWEPKPTAAAGSSVPLVFGLGGDRGLGVLAAGSPASREVDCLTGDRRSVWVKAVTAGQSALSYDVPSATYTYVWKTDPLWSGTCRELSLGLADTTVHGAIVRLK